MNNKKRTPLGDLTEGYSDIVDINKIQFDEDNTRLYGTDDPIYFEELCDSIEEFGLMKPVTIYSDMTLKSGHTRVRASRNRGYTHIPVRISNIKKPKQGFKNMMALQMENQSRPSDIKRQYNQITATVDAYTKEYGIKCSDDIIKKQICPASQMSYNQYTQLKELELKRKDLFNRVVNSNGSDLSPGVAYKFMREDAKKAGQNVMNQSKVLDRLISGDDVIYSTNVVSNAMNQLSNIGVNDRHGELVPAFDKIQQNTIGGLVHESFTNAMAHSINFKQDDPNYCVAFAPKNMSINDITLPLHNAGIEVKSCLIKDGNKVRFVSSKPKTGYFLFLAFTPEYDYVYCSYGYLKEEVWKRAGRAAANIDVDKLRKANLTEFFGTLKRDKKTGNIHCIPSSMSETARRVGFNL